MKDIYCLERSSGKVSRPGSFNTKYFRDRFRDLFGTKFFPRPIPILFCYHFLLRPVGTKKFRCIGFDTIKNIVTDGGSTEKLYQISYKHKCCWSDGQMGRRPSEAVEVAAIHVLCSCCSFASPPAAADSPSSLLLQIRPLLQISQTFLQTFPGQSCKTVDQYIPFYWVQFWPGILRQDFKIKKCRVMATKNLSCVENYATKYC